MYRRILTFLLACTMCFGCIEVSADTPNIFLNEVFDDYALNSQPDHIDMTGVDARIVQVKDSNKALYGKVWGSPVVFKIPISTKGNVVTFSFDILVKGDDVYGNILKLSESASLLKINDDGSLELDDGYKIGGLGGGVWHSYTARIDFGSKTYEVYVDGKMKLNDWLFRNKPQRPESFDFSFIPLNDDGITEIYVDNINVYSSDDILTKSDFPSKTPSDEVEEFTPTTEKSAGGKVYIDSKGSEGLPEIIFATKDDAVTDLATPPTGGAPCIHVLQQGTTDPFADVLVNFDEQLYVFQTDVYIASLSNIDDGLLEIVYPQGSTYSIMLCIEPHTGKLVCGNKILSVSVPTKKWVRLAVACNRFTSKVDVYMDGKLVESDVHVENASMQVAKFRLGFSSRRTAEIDNEVYFNNIKLYAGSEIKDFGDVNSNEIVDGGAQLTLMSRGEKATNAKQLIGTGAVFMSNCDFCYYDGEKRTYTESGFPAAYEDENGVIMVPVELLCRSLNIPVSSQDGVITASDKSVNVGVKGELDAAPAEKDGTVFVPAESFTKKILGKKAYCDDRYFVFVSHDPINLSNSPTITDNKEESDMLYRYMQYLRPDGDTIYNDIVQHSYQSHPRLLMTKDEIPGFREKIQNTPELKPILYDLLAECEEIIKSEPTEYKLNGFRLFDACHAVRSNVYSLALAYYATGDTKYLDRMWTEVQSALNWKDWNQDVHYLDSGEIGAGMALAYDTLYDYLTDEQKAYFRERITALYIDDAIYRYSKTEMLIHSNLTRSNWGALCFNSILFTALTFIDEEAPDSELTAKCKFLAAESIQAHEYVFGNTMPDGSICDGVGYMDFYSEGLTWSIKGIMGACGTDYGLLDAPSYQKILDYAMYIQSPIGCYNTSDTPQGEQHVFGANLLGIAKLSNDQSKIALAQKMFKIYNKSARHKAELLWYEPTDAAVDLASYPLDKFNPGQQIMTMRSSWDGLEPSYLSVIGGTNMNDQSHFDKGSFMLDLGGVRWFEDLGADNYNVTGGYFGQVGHTLYRTKTEGHNSLVINPDKTYPGQTLGGFAPLSYRESKEKGAIAVYNLTDVYQGQVNYYNRGFYLGEDRNTVVVRDELELTEANNDIYWFLHTANGKITISADGKSATVEKKGKKLKVEVLCNASEWKLEARDADYLFPEMNRGDEYSRAAYKKIALVGKASGKLNISAKFSVIDDGNTYAPLTDTPIAQWSIPDGKLVEKQKLDSISINGKNYSYFDPNVFEYVIEARADGAVPFIEAYSNSGVVTVKQAESLVDTAEVIFTNSSGIKNVYTIKFKIEVIITNKPLNTQPVVGLPADAEFAPIQKYLVNHEQGSNPAPGAVDGDLITRWSSDLEGAYYDIDLGNVRDLAGVGIVFNEGEGRRYKFDIMISDDGIHYTKIFNGLSVGGTSGWEYLAFNEKARFVRYVGYGHLDGEWNNLCEFRPCLLK